MESKSFLRIAGIILLLVSWVLMLVVSISAPVINSVALARVVLTNGTNLRHSSVSFGSFGYCIQDVPPITSEQDYCPPSHIGYQPATVMANIEKTHFSSASSSTINGLTRAMVLHPVVAVLAFIAFLIILIPNPVTSIIASFVALLAFFLCLIVMVIDFSAFGALKNKVNADGSGSHATFGAAMWLVLVSMLMLLFASFAALCSCWSLRKKHSHKHKKEFAPDYNPDARPKRTWYGKRRY